MWKEEEEVEEEDEERRMDEERMKEGGKMTGRREEMVWRHKVDWKEKGGLGVFQTFLYMIEEWERGEAHHLIFFSVLL